MNPSPDGLLLVDKPSGPTSHEVVRWIRRALAIARVGHAGTLDPLATGLLPIVLGRATRLVRFLPHSPKWYEGTLQLGVSTLTDDLSGEIVARHAGALPAPAEVAAAARGLHGVQLQEPPAVSARSVRGVRMYRANRSGLRIQAPPTEVTVTRFEVRPLHESAVFAFDSEVSAGTYVRALVRDLGRALGCGAALVSLRRTAIGPLRPSPALRLEAAHAPDAAVLAREIVPLEQMPLILPPLTLHDPIDQQRFEHGVRVAVPGESMPRETVRVHSPAGRLLGVGEVDAGFLCPRVVLAAEAP